jgi:hypothetical protein
LATPNYGYEKRQRELAKKQKKEEKLREKAQRKQSDTDAPMRAMRLHLRVTVQGRLPTERALFHHGLKLPLCSRVGCAAAQPARPGW